MSIWYILELLHLGDISLLTFLVCMLFITVFEPWLPLWFLERHGGESSMNNSFFSCSDMHSVTSSISVMLLSLVHRFLLGHSVHHAQEQWISWFNSAAFIHSPFPNKASCWKRRWFVHETRKHQRVTQAELKNLTQIFSTKSDLHKALQSSQDHKFGR